MFVIYGNVQFIPGKYDEWQAAYDNLDTYVWTNEAKTTLTYYFGIPVENKDDFSATNQMLAFEVYGKREDLYQTHLNSPAMKTFLTKVPSTMSTNLDLTHYEPTSGFLDKSGSAKECAVMYDTKIHCTSSAARNSILEKLESVAKREEEEEEGTFSFLALKSLDCEDQVRIFERYASFEELERQKRSGVMVRF